jgi:vacuolar protein sorting-associated protein 13A/C
LKTPESDWSKAISFDVAGTSIQTSLQLKNGLQILLGIDIQEGNGKYYLSKVISIKPRFILKNLCKTDLSFGIGGSIPPTLIKKDYSVNLSMMKPDYETGECQLSIKFANNLSKWSNPFTITDLGTVYVKVQKIGSTKEDLIKIDIQMEKATIFVSFSSGEERWPLRIDNESLIEVCYMQQDSNEQYIVLPREKRYYAWDYPSWINKKLVLEVNGQTRNVDMTEIGSRPPFKYPTNTGRDVMDLEIMAEGFVTVLKLRAHHKRGSDDKFRLIDDRRGSETDTTTTISKPKVM